jgi:hypothetical protein
LRDDPLLFYTSIFPIYPLQIAAAMKTTRNLRSLIMMMTMMKSPIKKEKKIKDMALMK